MSDMTLSKALSIFDIKKQYTAEEIKKIYINLMKQYHPDRYERESQEIKDEMTKKTQEINEAYEILKKNLTNQQQSVYETNSNYRNSQKNGNYRPKKDAKHTKKIKEIQEKIREYFKHCSGKKLMHEVYNLINEYIVQTEYSENPDLTFINFKIDLKELYRNYVNSYAKKHHVPSFLINQHKFNYDCDCAKLFSQLKDCEGNIEIDFSRIIRKYKCYEHFYTLEHKIIEEKDNIREKINVNTSQEEYSKILETYDNIINELIIDYSMKYTEFKIALRKISRQLTEEIKKELYKNIKSIVLNADEDEKIKLLISAIEESKTKKDSDIEEETEEIEIIENSTQTKETDKNSPKKMQIIREIVYKELKEKYLNVSKINIIEIDFINVLFMKAVELLYSENCTVGTLSEIKKLTFENPQEEYEKLTKVSKQNTTEYNENNQIEEDSSYKR